MSFPFHGRWATKFALALKIILLFIPIVIFAKDIIGALLGALEFDFTGYILAVPFVTLYLLYHNREQLRLSLREQSMITSFLSVPLLAFYFLIRRRKSVKESALANAHSLPSFFLGLFFACLAYAVAMYSLSYPIYAQQFHIIALVLLLASFSLILFGWPFLKAIAPALVALLFFCVPPIDVLYVIGGHFARVTTYISFVLLTALGLQVQVVRLDGVYHIYSHAASGQPLMLAVSLPCSGIYSLLCFALSAVLLFFLLAGPASKKLAAILLGFTATYALSVTRLCVLVLIAYYYGQSLAFEAFHYLGGTTLFLIAVFGTTYVANRWLGTKTFRPEEKCPYCEESRQLNEPFCLNCGRKVGKTDLKVDYKDLLVKVGVIALIVFFFVYTTIPVFVVQGEQAKIVLSGPYGISSEAILPKVGDLVPVYVSRLTWYERFCHEDAVYMYAYAPKDNPSAKVFWVLFEVTKYYPHGTISWLVCSRNMGWSVRHTSVWMSIDPSYTARVERFVVYNPSRRIVACSWGQRVLVHLEGQEVERNLGISVFAYMDELVLYGYVESVSDVDKAMSMAESILKTIIRYWHSFMVRRSFVLQARTWANYAVTSIGILAVLGVAVWSLSRTRMAEKLLRMSWFLDEDDKLLVLSVARGEGPIEGYAEATKSAPDLNVLRDRLRRLEKKGFLERTLDVKDGVLRAMWRSPLPTWPSAHERAHLELECFKRQPLRLYSLLLFSLGLLSLVFFTLLKPCVFELVSVSAIIIALFMFYLSCPPHIKASVAERILSSCFSALRSCPATQPTPLDFETEYVPPDRPVAEEICLRLSETLADGLKLAKKACVDRRLDKVTVVLKEPVVLACYSCPSAEKCPLVQGVRKLISKAFSAPCKPLRCKASENSITMVFQLEVRD